ncbi:hypothetical protein [Streptomyces sp. NPDC007063]|uniref:hypothetical protein n=1 Tax=Streptomyces sp. NPDC007063 TaxID=3364772 RepID=UPI0036AA485C
MNPLYADAVVRVRAEPQTDRYGNPSGERDWQNAERVEITGVSLQPASVDSSAEDGGDRQTIVTRWHLVSQRGRDLDITADDRVEAQGMSFDVDGEISRYRYGGRIHHVECYLERVVR